MILVFCSKENSIESLVDERFSRSKYFVFYNTNNNNHEILKNDLDLSHGAGPKIIQLMKDKSVDVIISPPLGNNAKKAAEIAGIKTIDQINTTVKENIDNFIKNISI